MYGRVIAAIVAFVGSMAGVGMIFEPLTQFGHPINEAGFPLLLIVLGPLAVLASYGRDSTVPWIEVCKVVGLSGATLLVASFVGVLGLVAGLVAAAALYGYPAIAGWNYLFVRRPLEQQAKKQQTLSAKLDADTELAEAMLRHERARAALADAEEAVSDAERVVGSKRS
jgi:hypothetical protein